MKDSLRHQLQRLGMRLAELDAHLADPQLGQDINRYRSVSREQAETAALVQRFEAYQQREADLAEARAMLSDPSLADFAQ
ncbi:MAG: peptide chain release factor 1, partial [Burkholderiales bacterium PBB5]